MRYRWVGVCVSTLLVGFAAAQDWVEQGGVKSREYKKEIRGAGGIEATEFFTLEYSVSVQIIEIGRAGTFMYCNNECKGKVHAKHEDCDNSCDKRCTEKEHKMTEKGWYFPFTAGMNEATAAANGLAIKGGGSVSPNDWSRRVSSALAAFKNECKKKKTFVMPHVGKPCTNGWWLVGTVTKEFKVRGTMKKVGRRVAGGKPTEINEIIGTHEQTVATGGIVQDDPLETNEWRMCFCIAPPAWEDTKKELIGENSTPLDPREQEELEWRVNENGVTCYGPDGNLIFNAQLEVSITGNDLNTVKLVLTNKSGQTVKVVLPPGILFLPSDPMFQAMLSLTRGEALIEAGETEVLYVNVGPPPATLSDIVLRWACLEMAKKEPNPSVKYRMSASKNDALINLAAITARSRFRGAHDQARIWIYTDKAPREEINKRMIPGVSAAMYSILLRDVAQRAGVDFSEGPWKALVTPSLLEGLNLDDRTVHWLVEFLASNKEKDLVSFLGQKTSALALLAGKEGADGAAYVAWIASGLLDESSSDLRKAAVKLLLAVPAENRAAVAKAGGLDGMRWLFLTDKEEMCALALDVFEAYGSEGRDILLASIEALPNDALKARAAKLTGIEMAVPR